jgi:hypothetical protein
LRNLLGRAAIHLVGLVLHSVLGGLTFGFDRVGCRFGAVFHRRPVSRVTHGIGLCFGSFVDGFSLVFNGVFRGAVASGKGKGRNYDSGGSKKADVLHFAGLRVVTHRVEAQTNDPANGSKIMAILWQKYARLPEKTAKTGRQS